MKSGNLNFLEPSGPLQACNGTALYISNEIFSPSNKIYREVGRAKDLSAPRVWVFANYSYILMLAQDFNWKETELCKLYIPVFRESAKCRYVCMSVRPSICNNSTLAEQIFVKFDMSIFRKSVDKIPVSWKSDKNNGYFTGRPIYILEWEMFQTKTVEKFKFH
jgi:hypothetical protein